MIVASWEGGVGERVKRWGIRYKLVVTEEPWGVKYSTGNGAAEELVCTTHGHEQCWVEGDRGGEIGTTLNCKINKK